MLTVALCALAAPLVALWATVVLACARDAMAPQPAPEPVPFVRLHVADRYRASVTDRIFTTNHQENRP